MAASPFPLGPGTKPRSSAPTRAAAVCRTLKPCQSSVSAPMPAASFHAAASIAAPSGRISAPCPTITIGSLRLAEAGFANSWLPSISPRSTDGLSPSATHRIGEIRPHGPITPIGKPPASQRLRMRAFSTGASWRGLLPISSSASASSMPSMLELNR